MLHYSTFMTFPWRFWVGGSCFLAALFAVLHAPAYPFWFVALGVTEWGYWMIPLALAPLWPSGLNTPKDRLGRRLGAAAAFLLLSPLLRAWPVARALPQQFAAAFPSAPLPSGIGLSARPAPLVWEDLFWGVSTPALRPKTLVYSVVGKQVLSLDLYRKDTLSVPAPGVIVVHGGSWTSGHRTELSTLSQYLAARGYVVAAVDYRFSPQYPFPSACQDVQAAIQYLKVRAKDFGLDSTQLVILGRSAGGQIALSVAYTSNDPAIRGAIAFYSPLDLVWGYARPGNPLILNSRRILSEYIGGTPDRVAGAFDAASPVNFIDAHTPPTLVIHGQRDELVWPHHSDVLSERLAKAGRPFVYLKLPWATHGCDAHFSGPCGQLTTYAVERFLAAVTSAKF